MSAPPGGTFISTRRKVGSSARTVYDSGLDVQQSGRPFGGTGVERRGYTQEEVSAPTREKGDELPTMETMKTREDGAPRAARRNTSQQLPT